MFIINFEPWLYTTSFSTVMSWAAASSGSNQTMRFMVRIVYAKIAMGIWPRWGRGLREETQWFAFGQAGSLILQRVTNTDGTGANVQVSSTSNWKPGKVR